jgi:acyl dehydratase
MRCYVEADDTARKARHAQGDVLPEHGPSPGVTNLKWIKPVYPGDTVTYWMEITAKREMVSRPRWGLATKHSEGFNQNGELVFAFDGKVMVQRKIPV